MSRRIVVGDIVRVQGERGAWRVTGVGRNTLDLESLTAYPRCTYTDLPKDLATLSEVP